jgi:hypothetical protein
MTSIRIWGMAVVMSTMAAVCGAAGKIGGTYVAERDAMRLTLAEGPGGAITGQLEDGGASIPLSGARKDGALRGTLGGAGNEIPFSATIEGDRVVLLLGAAGDVDAERVTFVRAAALPAATAGRHVSINGHRLSDAELARLEQAYTVHLSDADFWYDPVLGAWGLKGGPTRGFTMPGLNLGPPLPADASGGGTRVFVNGRALHPADLMALQQLTGPITPGRYFITAQGFAGYEGGPPLWDLRSLAARSSGAYDSWQGGILGSSGFSQDGYGAVFLPGGGNVSYGPN